MTIKNMTARTVLTPPRYKDSRVIFCDVCIRKVLDWQREKKQRKENPDGE